jgi:hypothetical protein
VVLARQNGQLKKEINKWEKISKNQFPIDSNCQTGQCHTYISIYIHGKPPYINCRCTYRTLGGETSLIVGRYYRPLGGEIFLIDGRHIPAIGRGHLPALWPVCAIELGGLPAGWPMSIGYRSGRSTRQMAGMYRLLIREVSPPNGRYKQAIKQRDLPAR